MVREFAIGIYLMFFKLVFSIFNKKDTQQKTTFVASFGGNIKLTVDMLEQQRPDMKVVILRTAECRADFTGEQRTVLNMRPKNLVQFIQSIYHLATSSHIMIDNYYGFLSVCDFKSEVKCVQLWHAAGAIKQFGLEDKTNTHRSKKALQRFQAVYDRFGLVVTGSDEMTDIFKRSFNLDDQHFLRTGIPRTDFFFNDLLKQEAQQRLIDYFPIIKDKKMLLYAPTYRDGALDSTALQLDMDRMYDQFKYEYVLFLRLHPAVEGEFANKYPGFVYNVSNYPYINDLLVGSDILMTDYSSIPFEYALLDKPMIFYAYDLEDYAHKRGIWNDYMNAVPGTVARDMEQLMDIIRNEDFHTERIRPFRDAWHTYNNGHATSQLIEALYDTTEQETAKIREHA